MINIYPQHLSNTDTLLRLDALQLVHYWSYFGEARWKISNEIGYVLARLNAHVMQFLQEFEYNITKLLPKVVAAASLMIRVLHITNILNSLYYFFLI